MNNSRTSIEFEEMKSFCPNRYLKWSKHSANTKHYAFCKDITNVENTLIQLMLILVFVLDEYS